MKVLNGFGLGFAALSVLFVAGCSKSVDEQIKPYESATLIPGKGLGDLVLGMTLNDFVAKMGSKQASYVLADGEAVEFMFAGGDISFMFPVKGACLDDMWKNRGTSSFREAGGNIGKWVEVTPSCGDITLNSISVRRGGFYQGATDHGVKLGDPVAKVYLYGKPVKNLHLPDMAAGAFSRNNPKNKLIYKEGIAYYYSGGEIDLKVGLIERMTIFKPENR